MKNLPRPISGIVLGLVDAITYLFICFLNEIRGYYILEITKIIEPLHASDLNTLGK